MGPGEDVQKLYAEIASLKRTMAKMVRMGTIDEVKDGRVRVKFQQGDVGDNGGKHQSPYIRTGHGGAVSEDDQYAKGENVFVFAAGGNEEHATIMRGGFSENHPRDGNADDKSRTRRWRKPPEEGQQDQGASGGSSGGSGDGQYGPDNEQGQKWKDDKDDLQEKQTHEEKWTKIGEVEYKVTKDGFHAKHGKREMKVDKDSAIMTDGEATLTVKGGKIVLKGDVRLGSENGDKIAVENKTRDSLGGLLQGPFAEKARAS